MRLRTIILAGPGGADLVPLGAIGLSADAGAGRSETELIVDRVETETGRRMEIDGRFDLDLSLTPSISAEDITFQNADWGLASANGADRPWRSRSTWCRCSAARWTFRASF